MGQQVNVYRELKFQGSANYNANITGNPMYDKVFFHDHFIADPSEKDWVESESYGGTITQSAANGGTVLITLGGSNDDSGEFSHAAQWSGAKNCVMEARVKIDNIATVGVNIGWVSVVEGADNQISFELDSGDDLVNDRAPDGAAFVFDTDAGTDVWYCAACKSNAELTPITFSGATHGATTVPENGTYATFRVALDTSGNATFFYNGEPVGYLASAVTAATLQCPLVSAIGRDGNARVITIDRITCWQDE